MKMFFQFCTAVVCTAVFAGVAIATPVSATSLEIRFSIAGDIDGLNLGLSPGEEFNWLDLPWGGAGEGVFDALIGGPSMPEISWTQEGFEDFNVMAGVGIIGSGGWGGVGILPELSLNGNNVGQFGDITSGSNLYGIDFFNLTPFANSLEQGTLTFGFNTPYANGWWDTGAVDFMLVGVIGTPMETAPVPEPATMLLFGTGLVGLVGARRRKKKTS